MKGHPYQHARPAQGQPQAPQGRAQPQGRPGPQARQQPPAQGYAVGEAGDGANIGRTVLIAVVSAAAGAIAVRLLDQYVFTGEREQIGQLEGDVQAIKEHLASQPQVVVPAMPAPVQRITEPPRGMTTDFWGRLSGDGDY